MSVKTGVWIDHKHAILVLVTDAGKEIKKISSGIDGPVRANSANSSTPTDYVADDKLERKFDNHLKIFYDEVIACLTGTEALLILGPGEAKEEFHKRVDSKKIRGLTIEVQTSDRMTDPQLAAKVAQHFAATPA
jgi:hypothetical protein